MPELSIIVPVYNVEEYLPKCIDSILVQTFTDFELILIDDGSPDRCGEICDEYAAKDSRIVVIHQKNQGVSAARNAGLDIAKGTYIGFVDSDDWIEPELYQTAIRTAETPYDIISFGIQYIEGDRIGGGLDPDAEYTQEELLSDLVAQPSQLGCGVVNKLYRRSLLRGVRFPIGFPMCEDRIFLFGAYSTARTCKSLCIRPYVVLSRPGSATRKQRIRPLYEIVRGTRKLLRLYWHDYRQLLPAAIDKYMTDCERTISQIRKLGQEQKLPFMGWIYRIKVQMLWALLRGSLNRSIKRTKRHSYLFVIMKR